MPFGFLEKNLAEIGQEFRVVFRFLTYIYIWANSRSRHGSARSLGNSTRLGYKNVSAMGGTGGTGPPNLNLGPPSNLGKY